jgi:hypothetical protein
MGCGGSRFDKRKENAGDLFTLPLQFIGGEGADDDGCPVDKVVFSFAKGEKEPKDVFDLEGIAAKSEESMKTIAVAVFNTVKGQLEWLEKEYKSSDNKVEYVGGKYAAEDAKKQLKGVLAELKEKSGFTFEEAKPADEKKDKEEAKPEGEVMMEGGDEMEDKKEEGMMGMEEPDLYADDKEDYAGFANFPKLLLRLITVYPYFGDLVKNDTVHFEFLAVKKGGFGFPALGALNPLALLKKGVEPGALAGAAALSSVVVNYS